MTPREAARMISGCADRRAARAASASPEAIASSTLRRKVRMRERRALLTSVRRAILRAAFLAEGVLAMSCSGYLDSIKPGRTLRRAPLTANNKSRLGLSTRPCFPHVLYGGGVAASTRPRPAVSQFEYGGRLTRLGTSTIRA